MQTGLHKAINITNIRLLFFMTWRYRRPGEIVPSWQDNSSKVVMSEACRVPTKRSEDGSAVFAIQLQFFEFINFHSEIGIIRFNQDNKYINLPVELFMQYADSYLKS